MNGHFTQKREVNGHNSEKLMDIIYYVATKILSVFNWLTKKINKNEDQNIF